MELSKKQQKIVNATEPRIIVEACAGAGKTGTLVARIQHLLDIGVNPTGIVAITFTNAASQEMLDRLNRPKGIFINTIHAYANYLLCAAGVDTSSVLDEEQFDQLFPLVKKNLQCLKPVQYLLIDEAQDSTPQHFEFLLDMVQPDNYMIFCDWRQSIYRWNGADPQYLIDLTQDPDVITYNLNENFRNSRNILEYAKGIIKLAGEDYEDDSIPIRIEKGRVCNVEYSPTAIARSIRDWGDSWKNWFVIARSNDQVDEMQAALNTFHIPNDTFKRSQLTNTELLTKMKNDTVKVLTIHTAKGLEAPNVVVVGARMYNLEEKCISYVAATRARDLLVWARVPNKPRRMQKVCNWEI